MSIVRGTTVKITVTFKDADGGVVTPAGALGKLSYLKAGARVVVDLTFVSSGAGFAALWNSSDANAGPVCWAARSSGGSPVSAVQGEFALDANPANLALWP